MKTILIITATTILLIGAILFSTSFSDTTDTPPQACGGFAGETGPFKCPTGYKCVYPKPAIPDGQGQCQPTLMGKLKNVF